MAVSERTSAAYQSDGSALAADIPLREAEEHFVEGMGLALEEDRLPRIAGRLVGLLMLSPEPVRFDHLAARLQVSRGSVSTNTRLLENMGVIERVTRPGDRRDYFQINEQPGLLRRIADRYRDRQAMAQEMKDALGQHAGGNAKSAVVEQRLERLVRFFSILAQSLDTVLASTADRNET